MMYSTREISPDAMQKPAGNKGKHTGGQRMETVEVHDGGRRLKCIDVINTTIYYRKFPTVC